MTELEYKEFAKRYEKFKDCNLPVRYWDDERQTLEFVYYVDRKDPDVWSNYNVSYSLFESFSAFTTIT